MKYEAASNRKKRVLADALKSLMLTKPLSKITVSELIKSCGVNRNTFYYHFEDIYDLLKWMLEQEAIEVVKNFELVQETEDAIRFVMDYVEENDVILNNIYHSLGRDELNRFFHRDFHEIIRSAIKESAELQKCTVPDSYQEFLCHFYTEALAGVLVEWITEDHHGDRELTVHYISSTLRASILASLKTYNTRTPASSN